MRAFLALYPDAEAREQMFRIVQELRDDRLPVKWEKADHIHITVKFLGDVRPETLRTVTDGLRENISSMASFRMTIDTLDAFPNRRKPRIVWLGSAAPPREASEIQRQLEDAFAAEGIEREGKRFTPHFTIGRVKQHGDISDLINVLEARSFQSFETAFRELRVMESTLTPQSAIHKEVDRIPFLIHP